MFTALLAVDALTIGTSPKVNAPALRMKLERLPGEGDPFCDGIRKPVDGPRPDMGIERWHVDSGYIDEDDEPWHATCKPRTATLTKGMLDSSFTSALPFVAPEEALLDALRKVTSAKEVDEAIAAGIAAGCRPGCPAIEVGEKLIAAAKKEGAEFKAAPPAKVTAQGKGFDDMGRALAKTHDNSV